MLRHFIAPFLGASFFAIALSAEAKPTTASKTKDPLAREGVTFSTSIASSPLNPFNLVQPGISIGYKFPRVTAAIGARLYFQNTERRFTPMMLNAPTQYVESTTGYIMVCPSLQASFVQWSSVKLEFIGHFSAGFGPIVGGNGFLFELYAAPGLRSWFHQHFSVVGLLGPEFSLMPRSFPISPRVEVQFLALF